MARRRIESEFRTSKMAKNFNLALIRKICKPEADEAPSLMQQGFCDFRERFMEDYSRFEVKMFAIAIFFGFFIMRITLSLFM